MKLLHILLLSATSLTIGLGTSITESPERPAETKPDKTSLAIELMEADGAFEGATGLAVESTNLAPFTDPVTPEAAPLELASLGNLEVRSYDLSLSAAASMDVPFVASVSGGLSRRVLVREYTQFVEVPVSDEVTHEVGYAVRLCVTTSKTNAEGKTTLAWLAASAEMKQSEAEYVLQVRGLGGPGVRSAALLPRDFDVETYVNAHNSVAEIIAAIDSDAVKFLPTVIARKEKRQVDPALDLERSVARAFALGRIAKRVSLKDALEDLGSRDVHRVEEVAGVYAAIVGTDNPNNDERPGDLAVQYAKDRLAGVGVSK